MNIKKATDGKKTLTGVIILALTPAISVVLMNFGITDPTQVLSAEIAGYVVGSAITCIGVIHKMIKRIRAKEKAKK